jgi:hypothetical protein
LGIAKWKFPNFDDGMLYRSKYQQEPLRAALHEVYSDRTLEEATSTRVVIPSVDLIHGRTITFKTPHQPDFIRDRKFKAVDVALATAAAPTYFPQASIAPGTFFSDGGLWANNPAIVGYAEAIKISQVCRRPDVDPTFGTDDIFMLSIGTGRPQYYANPGPADDGLLWWGSRLFDVAGGAQAQGIDFQARYLLGDEKYVRIDFEMPTEPWPLDAYDAVPQMLHYGEQAAVDNYALLKKMFFSLEKLPYKPFAT